MRIYQFINKSTKICCYSRYMESQKSWQKLNNTSPNPSRRRNKSPSIKATDRKAQLNQEQILLALDKKRKCNARAQEIVEKLLDPVIQPKELLSHIKYINQSHFEDVIQERSIENICGWVLCSNQLSKPPKQQYKIDIANKKVLDITERKLFCSGLCYKQAIFLKEQMFTNHVGQEKYSEKIIQCLIKQRNSDADILIHNQCDTQLSRLHYLIFQPLSKSILKKSVEEIVKDIKIAKLNSFVQQSFIWITPKNIEHPFIIQFVLHLADSLVDFMSDNEMVIMQKKAHGTIQKKYYSYKYVNNQIEVIETIKSKQKSRQEEQPTNPEKLTTFKIGNFSETELKAKTELEMSYEKIRKQNSGAIHYVPDEVDDFDEDDPDDDLDI
uniref:RNA polymerase II subunit B1 CTD phosphatase RPAP2 homolog n=2 Tax=Culicoides sonorensis TaxID=179676 RepID=A0A336LK97_CULSO